jgi:hypothetical protein
MHDEDSPGIPTPAREDDRLQEAVLHWLLAEHPQLITVSELIREFTQGRDETTQADAIERAVSELVGVGLLHRERDAIRPTRAAQRFEQLNRD